MFGLKPPANQQQRDYLKAYQEFWKFPPPAYAETLAEARQSIVIAKNSTTIRAPPV